MMRRRTRSTLPRPTTLFRSHTSELQSPQNLVCRLLLDWNSDVRSEEHTSELQSPQNLVCRLLLEKGREDRKSTRLNSSHLRISYAVFCLKKCFRCRGCAPWASHNFRAWAARLAPAPATALPTGRRGWRRTHFWPRSFQLNSVFFKRGGTPKNRRYSPPSRSAG